MALSDARYTINGLVGTDARVMDNLSKLCAASGSWLTYDFHAGKWSVIINRAGTSQWSFNDSNIIGALTISATGIEALYNSVKVTYPHEDLQNQSDFIQISIPTSDWYPNEVENTLNVNYGIVTNPVQAQLLGFIELKQSRVDKIIKFRTDYSRLSVKAGDLIDITSTVYGWTAKVFRAIMVREVDDDSGGINVEITALEYDADVYDEGNLIRYARTSNNGITTLGNIVAPSTPSVTTYQLDSRPRITATTQLSGGLADTVEFWYTTDVPPAVQVDANRTYRLMGSVKPTTGNIFPLSTDITVEVDNLSTSNFLIKCRALNSEATSSFSSPSGKIEYAPVQVAGSIGPNTTVTNSTGGLVTALGAVSLLNNIDGLFSGNSAAGGMFDKVFKTFKDVTGADLRKIYANSANKTASVTATYIAITYTFTDGQDLDTRTNIVYPNVGQASMPNYIGYDGTNQWPTTGTPILTWGGDNTGTGSESVLIDIAALRSVSPGAKLLKVRCAGYWYGDGSHAGTQPVLVNAHLYSGGSPSLSNYQWTVTGSSADVTLPSSSSRVYTHAQGSTTSVTGDFLATFVFDLESNTGSFEY
jgi:hypothetical protein